MESIVKSELDKVCITFCQMLREKVQEVWNNIYGRLLTVLLISLRPLNNTAIFTRLADKYSHFV